jgi:hypothetical protein
MSPINFNLNFIDLILDILLPHCRYLLLSFLQKLQLLPQSLSDGLVVLQLLLNHVLSIVLDLNS